MLNISTFMLETTESSALDKCNF